MRSKLVASLGVLCLLAGCATNSARQITALDQTDFVNTATGDRLHLGLRGPYTLTYAETLPSDRGRPRVVMGHWDLLSTPQQVITLDGRTPVRLSYHPGTKEAWRFMPLMLAGQSTLAPVEVANYEPMQGQWLARKSDLQPQGDEQSLAAMLAPEARGTR